MSNMIVTQSGVDRICVAGRDEASGVLYSLYQNTSLSKKEIVESVSFNLSVADVVRVCNGFFRADEGKVVSYADAFRRAA